MATKYVIVCGGVVSGVGKGIVSASIGKVLQQYGYTVCPIKIDPYINLDAGTMRPTEHGEVWVTDDGGEIDQDLGNYERFLNCDVPRRHNITTGQVYKTVIERERNGEYLGRDVRPIPDIPHEVIRRFKEAAARYDVAIVEIGGVVGDFENLPFLFATKMLERELGRDNVTHILVSYLPIPHNLGEPKTKPTQQAVKHLTECGIFPDFIVARTHEELDAIRRKKIETYAHVDADNIISCPDVKNVYTVPILFHENKFGKKILDKLKLEQRQAPDWTKWKRLLTNLESPKQKIRIAIVGKYIDTGDFTLEDSYISVKQSIVHACTHRAAAPQIIWLDAKDFEQDASRLDQLDHVDAVIVPGGFGASGVEGKILAIQYCRENDIPYLGLCYGMQLAVIEFMRNSVGYKEAHTTEVDPTTATPVIKVLQEQRKILLQKQMGGTMRLGAYAAQIKENSKVATLYEQTSRISKDQARLQSLREDPNVQFRIGGQQDDQHTTILERHRHRYEVNPEYIKTLTDAGLTISGVHHTTDGTPLVEFIELQNHPYFVATQSHPEFKSRPLDPAPLFLGLIDAAVSRRQMEVEKRSRV